MTLDAQNPAILALLVERIEQLTLAVQETRNLAMIVNTHAVKIQELEKDNSNHVLGINEAATFAASARGGTKVLYAAMLIFSGIMGAGTGVAIGLFFKDSQTIAALTSTVQSLRGDVDILLGSKR